MRLPAYAKRLIEARRAGWHPMCIHIEFDEGRYLRRTRCEFFCDESHPVLKVQPSEFEPGRFDWRAVTACAAEIFDFGGELDSATPGRVRQLAIEIGRYAGPISIYTPSRAFPLAPQALSWWPDEVEAINAKRREAWGRRCRAWLDAGGPRAAATAARAA